LLVVQPLVADDRDKLADLVTGWEQNRRLIGDVFFCEFTLDVYDYKDVENPILLYTQSGVWARHGEYERYSLHCRMPPKHSEDESTPQKSFEKRLTRSHGMGGGGPCWNEHYLQCNNVQLNYSPVLSTANISQRIQTSRGITTTPLSYGVMGANEYRSLPKIIGNAAETDGTQTQVTLLEDSRTDGSIVLTTMRRETSSSGNRWDNIMDWRVDPKSGFLPLEVTVFDSPGVWASKTTVNEVREIKSGAYWPVSVQTITNPKSVFPRMFQLKTTLLSFDAAKVKNKLLLPVHLGTKVVNPENTRSLFVFEKQEIQTRNGDRSSSQAPSAINWTCPSFVLC
jgi:hypothetical protein